MLCNLWKGAENNVENKLREYETKLENWLEIKYGFLLVSKLCNIPCTIKQSLKNRIRPYLFLVATIIFIHNFRTHMEKLDGTAEVSKSIYI